MYCWVTGGAGFIGSHLCERLLEQGIDVRAIDNLSSGNLENIQDLEARYPGRFEFVRRDVCENWPLPLSRVRQPNVIYHLASLASPRQYKRDPLGTIRANTTGTLQALKFAKRVRGQLVYASTSEVYGDPQELPQREESVGAISPSSTRAPYSLSKAAGEAAVIAFARQEKLPAHVLRIFNTYGPRMASGDGRCVPTFIARALRNEPLQLVGGGEQTRSLCYVSDTVEALVACGLRPPAELGPYNVGGELEMPILQLAEIIVKITGSQSFIQTLPNDVEEPRRRCPDISRAREHLGWFPRVSLEEGLERTITTYAR